MGSVGTYILSPHQYSYHETVHTLKEKLRAKTALFTDPLRCMGILTASGWMHTLQRPDAGMHLGE